MSAREIEEGIPQRFSVWDDAENVQYILRVTPELAECLELLGGVLMCNLHEETKKAGFTDGANLARMILYRAMIDFEKNNRGY